MSNFTANEERSELDIAVIGMAGRFPGARTVEEFWQHVRDGVESIAFFSEQELLAAGIDPTVVQQPHYVRAKGVLEDIDLFDAEFFGCHAREAEVMDPQQRVFLETAWEALEHAGYNPYTYDKLISVYAGASDNTYLLANLWPQQDLIRRVGTAQVALGNSKDHLATRVAYKLDLKGPGVNVQTACSTSLVAVHMACQSLLHGESDIALAGGVSIVVPQKGGYVYREGGTNSPDGHCRAFDAQAQGMVSGNGVGVVVLKRLEEALADGDAIHAVIRSSAMNNDGSQKVGYTAPGIEGQAQVIKTTHEMAEVHPETITYIEAHGTGTAIGDPIEIAALTKAFAEGTQKKQFCALGSVKTNIGHLDAAAGVSGLIKTICALKYRQIPPSLHFETPNPQIDFAQSPFYVSKQLADWPATTGPRRAGVSSFGIGGTNAHVLLEEAPIREGSVSPRPWQLLLLSARSETALQTAVERLEQHMASHPDLNVADVAYTLQVGRKAFNHRLALVCATTASPTAVLAEAQGRQAQGVLASTHPRPILFLFPGQGSQYVQMGQELYQSERVFREHVDHCCHILQEHLGLDLREILYPAREQEAEASERLRQTAVTQPALFVIEYALARLWMHWGIQPQAMIGHSIGEYVAACLAGVFSLEDALRLVALRGQLMQALPTGAMLAVPLTAEQVAPYLGTDVALAATNAPTRTVISGPTEAIERVEQQLTAQGQRFARLHTSHAFHSAMMEPMLSTFTAYLVRIKFAPPTIPYVSNVTGRLITDAQATDPHYWAEHLRQCVRFAEGLDTVLSEQQWITLEVGPGHALTSLLKLHPRKTAVAHSLCSLRHPHEQRADAAMFLQTLGTIWQAGGEVAWSAFYEDEHRLRVPLPTYPFERKRFWVEAPSIRQRQIADAVVDVHLKNNLSLVEEQESTMSEKSEPLSEQRAQLIQTLTGILADQLGMSTEEIDTHFTFFELGADSMLLLQISQAVRDAFGIAVPFRMLFEEVATIDALSIYLEHVLPTPAPRKAEPVLAQQTLATTEALAVLTTWPQLASEEVVTATNGHSTNGHHTNGHSSNGATRQAMSQKPEKSLPSAPQPMRPLANSELPGMQQIVSQQLQLMAQQLDLLSNASLQMAQPEERVTIAEVHDEQPVTRMLPQLGLPSAASNVPNTGQISVDEQLAPSLKIDPETYVPYKPFKNRSLTGLTSDQKAHIEALISRLNQKTRKSKEFAQTYRTVLADNRTSAGFNQTLKEITYSIVPDRAEGAHLWDIDGNAYVDITMGFGALLFGHSPAFLIDALEKQLKKGTLLGLQSSDAGEVAKMMCAMTGQERVTFCNSGTEAVMSALRFARTITGRQRIALFSGSFHGTFDGVLVHGQEGAHGQLTPVPMAPGVPKSIVDDALILRFGYRDSLRLLRENMHELAAVLVELPQSRRPDLHPVDFLQELRAMTEASGVALIFDEVVTGFRTHPGGASAVLGVKPDLVTYGKAAGAGLPLGVVAGKALYMDAIDGGIWNFGDTSYPRSLQTFFAGTYFKHPLLMAGVRATCEHLMQSGPQLQERLTARTEQLVNDLNTMFERLQVKMQVANFGSLFRFMLPPEFKQVASSVFYYNLLDKGIYIPEGRSCFLSTAHTEEDITAIQHAVEQTILEMRACGFFYQAPGTDPDGGLPIVREETSIRTEASQHGLHQGESALALSILPAKLLPMTEEQRELWVLSHIGEEAGIAYNEMLALRFQGTLNRAALQETFQSLINRHEALRTAFSADGEQQCIYTALPFKLTDRDLTDMAEVQAWMQEELGRPFDLEHGPLLRASLLKIQPQQHILVMTFHHIIIDGWSVGILLNELSTLYTAFCTGQSAQLPATLQYSDYTRWKEGQSQAMQQAESYWLQQFADALPVLQLPTDHARPQIKTYRGARKTSVVSAELSKQLKKVSARKNASFFGMLLSLFSTFLHQVSGQDDLVVGIPVAGQIAMDGGNFLGHAANLVLVRSQQADHHQPFSAYLTTLKKTLLQANKQQIYPFLQLVKLLNPQRDASRLSVISAVFNLDRGGTFALHQLATNFLQPPQRTARYDISVNVTEMPNGLLIDCDYDSDLFDEKTIERWMQHYQDLMEAVVEQSEQPISMLPLLTHSERELMLKTWNDTQVDYEQNCLLHQLFQERVALHPGKIAVHFQGKTLTYQELDQQAERLAELLRAQGVGPNVLVGICVKRSLEMMIGLLGILKAGGAYVPLDPNYPSERLAFILADTQAPLVLTQQSLFAALADYQGTLINLDHLTDIPGASPVARSTSVPSTPDQLAYVIYTSGSTGQPKGVMLSHRNVTNFCLGMDQRLAVEQPGVWLAVTSISFDISVLELLWTLTRGFEVVIQAELNEADPSNQASSEDFTVATQIGRYGVTHLQCTPSLMRVLLADPPTKLALATLTCLMLGGEQFPLSLAEELRALVRGRVLNMYGPTETTIWSSTFALGVPENGMAIGTPIANTTMYILDKLHRPVALGVSGELAIGGLGVAQGYLKRPALTAERFIPDPFSTQPGSRLYCTGDVVRYRADGCIEYLGRSDSQVKIRGFRIELGEIEAVLNQHPAIQEAAVRVWQEQAEMSRIAAYLVARPQMEVHPTELRMYLKKRLPDSLLPHSFTVLPSLPLTANGKIDRKSLPHPEVLEPETSTYVAPEGAVEELLAQMWCQFLGLERVGRDDNFFALGGDSILALRIVTKAKAQGLILQPKQLFRYQTIAELAGLLASTSPGQVSKLGDTSVLPLTPIQHWFFGQRLEHPQHFNMSVLLEASQPLNTDVLERAGRLLVQRHEALRLRFVQPERGTWQAQLSLDDALKFVTIDLTALAPAEVESTLDQNMHALQTSFELSSSPLICMAHIRMRATQSERVLIIVHHLAIDITSWHIFLEELSHCYTQLCQGQGPDLPPVPTSYSQWAITQSEYASSQALRQEAAYWLDPARKQIKPLPVDHAGGVNTEEVCAVERFTLDEGTTKALQLLAQRRYQTQVSDLVLAALATTLAAWTGQSKILIDQEGHGRETLSAEVNLARTVGWFTAVVPTLLQLPALGDMDRVVACVKEQLRAIPQGGIGYGLLRYLCQDAHIMQAMQQLPAAEVSFHYVGNRAQATGQNLGGLFTLAQGSRGHERSLTDRRRHKLEVVATLVGGQLRLEWIYSTDVHTSKTIQRLAQGMSEQLQQLLCLPESSEPKDKTRKNKRAHVDQPQLTPEPSGQETSLQPDTSLAKLSQEKVTSLLTKLSFQK